MKYFIADTHFDHAKIIALANYPFANVEDMNETMVRNWNAVVKRGDVVYHLGDFGFGPNLERIFKRLNGQIHLICGNHDRNNVKYLFKRFASVRDLAGVKLGDYEAMLCHYPMQRWNKSHHGAFHLHGHCHGHLGSPYMRRLDVGAPVWDWTPISEEAVVEQLRWMPAHDHHLGGLCR